MCYGCYETVAQQRATSCCHRSVNSSDPNASRFQVCLHVSSLCRLRNRKALPSLVFGVVAWFRPSPSGSAGGHLWNVGRLWLGCGFRVQEGGGRRIPLEGGGWMPGNAQRGAYNPPRNIHILRSSPTTLPRTYLIAPSGWARICKPR